MNIYKSLLLFCFLLSASYAAVAQKKQIDLRDIWVSGVFAPKYVAGFNFLVDGNHYARMERNAEKRTEVAEYSIATGERTRALYTAPEGIELDGYEWSEDGQKMLLVTEEEAIYRHSTQANFFVYDRKTEQRQALSTQGKQRYATFSPKADKVAFVRGNNLYYKDLQTGEETQITQDGAPNSIINGATDWVYEEEFAIDKAFFFSPNGQYIAFLRFDESKVKEFRLTYFLGELYPTESVFKYPKAGEDNSVLSVHIYDIKAKSIQKVDIGGTDDQYIPRLKWNPENQLCVFRLNRLQNQLTLLLADPKTGKTTTLLEETNPYFINIHDNLTFLDKGEFLWTSEKDGYNHIYLHGRDGKQLKQLTNGKWEVTEVYGYDPKGNTIYLQTAQRSPLEREICALNLKNGKLQELSTEKGTNEASFSANFRYYILRHSSISALPSHKVFETDKNKLVRSLEDNKALAERLAQYDMAGVKFFQFTHSDNIQLNGWMLTPPNFDSTKRYPVFMMAYGGPGHQTVLNKWQNLHEGWYHLLAQKGYIVVSVDGRGTGARGQEFTKSTYLQLGKYECIDQIEAARYLAKQPYVDGGRIGIFGWSFGGYLSSLCLAKGADVFKMAIAVAPVIHWKWYDTIYTERYLRTPKENASGYDDNSPVNFAQLIKGKYLLVHGTADDNVHAQNAFEMVDALVEKNIPFEQAFYTNKNHGIYGGYTRLHLYQKMTDFVLQNL